MGNESNAAGKMKSLKILSWILLIGLVGGCASEKRKRAEFFGPKDATSSAAKRKEKQQAPPFSRAEAEDAICEAVTRRFARDASNQLKTPVKVVFLSLSPSKREPDTVFLSRFGKNGPRALPVSAAVWSAENSLVEKQTGDRGVLLRVERVDWLDYYSVQVPCAWSADASNELTFVYKLTWKRGQWTVL